MNFLDKLSSLTIKSVLSVALISAVSTWTAFGITSFGNNTYSFIASLSANQTEAAAAASIPHTVASGWCTCPYYVVFIGGTRSHQGDDEYKWIKNNFPTAQQNYLSLDNVQGDLSPAKIKQVYTTVLNQVNAHHRVLIVGSSLGASVAQNVITKIKSDCIDLIAADPPLWSNFPTPLNTLFGKFMSSIFRNDATQIIQAEENNITKNPDYINWTNGTVTDESAGLLHSPFGLTTPGALLQLYDLQNTVNHKTDSCKLTVTAHVLKADGTVATGDVVTLKYIDAMRLVESLYVTTDTSGNAAFSDLVPYIRQIPASTVQAATLDDSNTQSDPTPIPIKDGEKVTLKLKAPKSTSQCINFQASAPQWKLTTTPLHNNSYYSSSQPIATLPAGNYILTYMSGSYDTPNIAGSDVHWITGFNYGGFTGWDVGGVLSSNIPSTPNPGTLLESNYSNSDHPLFVEDVTTGRTEAQLEAADRTEVQDRFTLTKNTPVYYELDVTTNGFPSVSRTFATQGVGYPKFKICPDTTTGSKDERKAIGNPLIERPTNPVPTNPSLLFTAKVGVFRNNDGSWSLDQNADKKYDSGDLVLSYGGHGSPADFPLIGDWNGNVTDEIGVFHVQNHQFVLDTNASGVYEGTDAAFTLNVTGTSGNLKPVVGDWNGSGTTKVGVYDQNNGTFYLDYNGNHVWDGASGGDKVISGFKFIAGDTWYPLAGDWNGTGKVSIGSYDMNTGIFYLDLNNDGAYTATDTTVNTASGFLPVYGKMSSDNKTDVGVYDPSTGTFTLYINGSATTITSWGGAGDQPVIYNNLVQKTVVVNPTSPPTPPPPSPSPEPSQTASPSSSGSPSPSSGF